MDLEKILNSIQKVLNWMFQGHVPPWLIQAIGYALSIGFLLLGVWGLLYVLGKIRKLWVEEFKPTFYKPEEKRRSLRRRRFADHLESEIRRLNNLEAWSDYRFAELEAEVEAEGGRRSLVNLAWLSKKRGLRRERSLSKALQLSTARLISLEGEPGAGKSVALRHVAQRLAKKASQSKNAATIIPIYINLKEMERSRGETVDKNLIHNFVLKTLNRINDRDIEEFLDEEFDRGMKEGSWFFLFDSFDELPEVLSSTEADSVIKNYSDAISDFLHGLNSCRGIIASRHFRGPVAAGWPRFRILPLSEIRRLELIRKIGFSPQVEQDFIGELSNARNEIMSMSANPMFLSLVCEHIRGGQPFPTNSHSVFETYVQTRLSRDESRLARRFGLTTGRVRRVAEQTAFCMTADVGLGLSPMRLNLRAAMARQEMDIDIAFDSVLDALEYIKLARSDTFAGTTDTKAFTFAHRRFQEYFATNVVLSNPGRIGPEKLLFDARWRETAVVMCQTQPQQVLEPLIDNAQISLHNIAAQLPIRNDIQDLKSVSTIIRAESESLNFRLEPKSIHILGLLQDGFAGRLEELPDELRIEAGRLIQFASRHAALYDRKWGLQVAGIIPTLLLQDVLSRGFEGQSRWLKDTAYQQTARLGQMTDGIAKAIRAAVVELSTRGTLRKERFTTYAHLARCDRSSHFLSVFRLLVWLPLVDGLLVPLVFIVLGLGADSSLQILSIFFLASLVWYVPWLVNAIMPRASLIRPMLFGSLRFSLLIGSFIFLVTVLRLRANPRIGLVPLLVVPYLLIWTPVAWSHAREGRFLSPFFWPFIPILRVLRLQAWLRKFPAAWKSFVRYWKNLRHLRIQSIIEGSIELLTFPIFASAFILLMFLEAVSVAVVSTKDLLRWIKWRRAPQSKMTAKRFVTLVSAFHTPTYCVRFTQFIRQNDLVAADDEADLLLTAFASGLELGRIRLKPKPIMSSANKLLSKLKVVRWLGDSIHLIEFITEQHPTQIPDYIDEANMLLEQIRAKKTG